MLDREMKEAKLSLQRVLTIEHARYLALPTEVPLAAYTDIPGLQKWEDILRIYLRQFIAAGHTLLHRPGRATCKQCGTFANKSNYKCLLLPCEGGHTPDQAPAHLPPAAPVPFETGLKREAGTLVPVAIARRLNAEHMRACRQAQYRALRQDRNAGWHAFLRITSAHQPNLGLIPRWVHTYVDPSHQPYLIGGAVFCPKCVSVATEPTHHGKIGSGAPCQSFNLSFPAWRTTYSSPYHQNKVRTLLQGRFHVDVGRCWPDVDGGKGPRQAYRIIFNFRSRLWQFRGGPCQRQGEGRKKSRGPPPPSQPVLATASSTTTAASGTPAPRLPVIGPTPSTQPDWKQRSMQQWQERRWQRSW